MNPNLITASADQVRQTRWDGYIECTQCGHTVGYDHHQAGCDLCDCAARWTVRAKQELPRRLRPAPPVEASVAG
jgi:Zn finger protein HypA/HybF involved in hydrogenase expression